MIRPILQLPEPVLRRVSTPVAKIDDEIKKLIKDMFETMYDAPGIGLAAVQIGVAKRVVTIDATRGEEEKNPMVFINPEIVSSSDEKDVKEEGCLSIAEYYEEVERPSAVTVRYIDEKGKTQEIEAEGLLARALQHEIDHLNGVLFIDHLSKLKRDRVTKKFTKAAKANKRTAPAGA
jgi:peptide deformylase